MGYANRVRFHSKLVTLWNDKKTENKLNKPTRLVLIDWSLREKQNRSKTHQIHSTSPSLFQYFVSMPRLFVNGHFIAKVKITSEYFVFVVSQSQWPSVIWKLMIWSRILSDATLPTRTRSSKLINSRPLANYIFLLIISCFNYRPFETVNDIRWHCLLRNFEWWPMQVQRVSVKS